MRVNGDVRRAIPPRELFYHIVLRYIYIAVRRYAEYVVIVVFARMFAKIGYRGCDEGGLFMQLAGYGIYGQFAVLHAAARQRE